MIAPIQIAPQCVQWVGVWMQYHTTDAAKACNVTLNTIRNWCKDYSAFLSAGATVTTGQREFTGRDMEVFKYIALLRSEGMQKDAIVQRLGETTFSEIAGTEEERAIARTDTPASLEASADSRQGQETSILSIQLLDAINAQNRKIEALERSARPGWWLFVAGVLCGLGFAAVAELFALVARR